jgi:hypothetical protein
MERLYRSSLGTYPSCDIDKVRERGETWAVDPETGEAINRLGAGLDQLGSKLDRLGADLRGEIRTSADETRAYVDERIQNSTTEMRRHFEVVGESLRGEIRSVAELLALSNEQRDRRDDEQAARSDGIEDRVLKLEVDVSRLKAGRKPRRPRRR